MTRHLETDAPLFATLSLADLFGAVWRHRLSVIVCTILLLPLLIVAILLLPAKFDSYAQLLVRLGRETVSMDPTTQLTPTVSLQDSRENQVNSVREMLHSRVLAERVVDRVGAERILQPRGIVAENIASVMEMLPSREAKPMGDLTADEVEQHLRREAAVKKLSSVLEIFAPKDTYTINLEARTGSPFLSQDILEAYIDEYQTYHIDAHRSVGSVQFFREQTDEAFKKAMDAKEALREGRNQRRMIEIGAAKSSLHDRIGQIRSELITTDSDIASLESQLVTLAKMVTSSPNEIQAETVTGIPRATGDSLRSSLYSLELQYQDLAAKYAPDHPRLQAISDQLESAAKIAESEKGEQPQTKLALNPIKQSLELRQQTATAELEGFRSKKKALSDELAKLENNMEQINLDEVELTRLQWEVSLTEQDYLRAAEQRNRADQLAALDAQRLSEVSVAQTPTLVLKKVSPPRSLLGVMAIFAAVGLSVGQALIRGLLKPVPKSSNSRPSKQTSFEGLSAEQARNEWDQEVAPEKGQSEPVAMTGTTPR
ncbi:MAG: Wzz/FepE/Etk N-terminal domain-containing protein [Planctomycetota bacterium]